MLSRSDRRRRAIQIESLEGRNAPSRFGALAAHLAEQHHNRHGGPAGGHHEVRALHGGGHDDPANHDQNDDRGAHRGNDDPANHDRNDDRGRDGRGHR